MKTTYVGLIRLATMSIVSLAAIAHVGAASKPATLVEDVRRATSRFQDVAAAQAAGYAPFLGCVSGPGEGARGIQYVNGDLVGDGMLDSQQPEALLYEASNGRLRLLGVEYIVIAEAWNAKNTTAPTLGGQVFHYTGSPNRYGLPPFYALHVWAWKANANGMFADFNPKVSCEEFTQAPDPTSTAPGARN
jgi:hypothetical protein